MASEKHLLDTDVLSAVMRQQSQVLAHARLYLGDHGRLTISLVTRYEVLRGLKAKNAQTQLAAFDALCDTLEIVPLSDAIIRRASDIYAHLHQQGRLIEDADILIAATAIESGCVLVTNNESHFSRIPGLVIENWLAQ